MVVNMINIITFLVRLACWLASSALLFTRPSSQKTAVSTVHNNVKAGV